MMQIKIFTYSPDLSLSHKYFKVVLQYLRPKIFNEKVKVLFDFFIE